MGAARHKSGTLRQSVRCADEQSARRGIAGCPGWTRTINPLDQNQMLCQLSHGAVFLQEYRKRRAVHGSGGMTRPTGLTDVSRGRAIAFCIRRTHVCPILSGTPLRGHFFTPCSLTLPHCVDYCGNHHDILLLTHSSRRVEGVGPAKPWQPPQPRLRKGATSYLAQREGR